MPYVSAGKRPAGINDEHIHLPKFFSETIKDIKIHRTDDISVPVIRVNLAYLTESEEIPVPFILIPQVYFYLMVTCVIPDSTLDILLILIPVSIGVS